MDKQRNPIMVLVFSIISFGFYAFYWHAKVQGGLHERTGEGFTAGVHILMLLITFGIYALVWQYKAGKRLAKLGAEDRSAMYLILAFIGIGGIVNPILMQSDINKILEKG